jgi:DNA-binding response OmpR family regulator
VRVLVLEDDPDVRRAVVRFVRRAGYVVDEAVDLAGADERFAVNEYDVAVLDRTVPDGDAIALVARLRADGVRVPIVFLTAQDAVESRVAGLGVGADDYLVKPFAMEELVARVHALARRTPGPVSMPMLTVGDVVLDPSRAVVTRASRPVDLTAKEFALLRYLMTRAGSVVSRSELIEHCWDEHADPMSNVVDVRIASLRRRLGNPPMVQTVRGVGYLLEARADHS